MSVRSDSASDNDNHEKRCDQSRYSVQDDHSHRRGGSRGVVRTVREWLVTIISSTISKRVGIRTHTGREPTSVTKYLAPHSCRKDRIEGGEDTIVPASYRTLRCCALSTTMFGYDRRIRCRIAVLRSVWPRSDTIRDKDGAASELAPLACMPPMIERTHCVCEPHDISTGD